MRMFLLAAICATLFVPRVTLAQDGPTDVQILYRKITDLEEELKREERRCGKAEAGARDSRLEECVNSPRDQALITARLADAKADLTLLFSGHKKSRWDE